MENTTLAKPRVSFLTRFFAGRVNRREYIAGILIVSVAIAIISTILFAIFSFFFNTNVITAFLLCMVFVVFLFYAFSLSLRRLHDLNRSGLFLLLFLPGEVGTLLYLIASFAGSLQVTILQLLRTIPPYIDIVFTAIRWIANVFILYMLLWPGNEETNKYGPPINGIRIKETLGLTTPQPVMKDEVMAEETTATTNY